MSKANRDDEWNQFAENARPLIRAQVSINLSGRFNSNERDNVEQEVFLTLLNVKATTRSWSVMLRMVRIISKRKCIDFLRAFYRDQSLLNGAKEKARVVTTETISPDQLHSAYSRAAEYVETHPNGHADEHAVLILRRLVGVGSRRWPPCIRDLAKDFGTSQHHIQNTWRKIVRKAGDDLNGDN